MNNATAYQIIKWVAIILFQVLILSQIELNRFVSPYLYPLFILILPFETPIWAVMLIGFGTGLTIDVFGNSPGLHAAATVFMSYVRGSIIALKKPTGDYAEDQQPDLDSMGFNWFLAYAVICIVAHHLIYFLLEVFSLSYMPYIFAKTACSSAISLSLIMLSRYLFSSRH